ncbi:hypothetical protein BKA93DRAFT_784356 [Sparassis latifolia]|uniref:Uncharacterized protein n=1 Tax=Sparassis crispa TaxID=139825 RepID=A0A401G7I1_9APHY|nr:hypothetical protein SCP_0110090 [Sparassis crispa]GBE78126.1 hypothetical protein SCP_0110090 [Sparassis crispa]
MPRQPTQPTPSTIPQHHDGSDTKVPYDDLIDQYATSYKAYTVDPSSFHSSQTSHHKPSYSLTKQTNDSDITVKDIKDVEGESTERLDWGYPPPTTQPEKEKEKRKLWSVFLPDSIACRLYLLTVLVETAIDLAIEAEIFVRLQESRDANGSDNVASLKMPVYLSIFAIAHLFQFVMALDAVHARNTLQFIALAIFNAVFLVYAVIQIGEIRGSLPTTSGTSHIPIDVLTTIIPIVISVAELAYLALGWKIYTEFGWKVYKFLGADRQIKAMYAYFQIYLCLVKFDVFFWVGFSVQFIWLVLNSHNAEYYLTCLALPLSIVVLVIGDQAARRENKWMMLAFMTGCVGAMVYFLYKLVKVLRLKSTATFILVWQTLTTFSVIAIALLILTFVFACIVMNNFGRGLKTRVGNNSTLKQRGKSQDLYRGPMSNHPNRMSIE